MMDDHSASDAATPDSAVDAAPDSRLYIPDHAGWEAKVKRSWDKDYCFSKAPGQEFFHLLVHGEIFLQRAEEKFCLTCALRRGIVTTNRLYWQRAGVRPPLPS